MRDLHPLPEQLTLLLLTTKHIPISRQYNNFPLRSSVFAFRPGASSFVSVQICFLLEKIGLAGTGSNDKNTHSLEYGVVMCTNSDCIVVNRLFLSFCFVEAFEFTLASVSLRMAQIHVSIFPILRG